MTESAGGVRKRRAVEQYDWPVHDGPLMTRELKFLQENYPTRGKRYCAKALGRRPRFIEGVVSRHKIKSALTPAQIAAREARFKAPAVRLPQRLKFDLQRAIAESLQRERERVAARAAEIVRAEAMQRSEPPPCWEQENEFRWVSRKSGFVVRKTGPHEDARWMVQSRRQCSRQSALRGPAGGVKVWRTAAEAMWAVEDMIKHGVAA